MSSSVLAGSHGSLPTLVGIGMTFKRDKDIGSYVVKRVLENGPAGRLGYIESGDVFEEVDGIKVANKTPEEVTRLVLGPAGSRVDIVTVRGGDFPVFAAHQWFLLL